MSLAHKVTTGTNNFLSLIVKFIVPEFLLLLLLLLLLLSVPAAGKTQYFADLSFNSTFYLINGISSDLPMLRKYFNGTAIPLAPSASVFFSNLALYMKDLKLLVFAIFALKLVVSSFELKCKITSCCFRIIWAVLC